MKALREFVKGILKKRKIIGIIEEIFLENKKSYKSKIDTGADYNSIDSDLLAKLGEKQITGYKLIKSALGKQKRAFVDLEITLAGETFTTPFSIADRSTLKYKILIGKNLMKEKKYLIDPTYEVTRK